MKISKAMLETKATWQLSGPKMDPFWGGRVLENTLNSKRFGTFPALRGIHLRFHFRITGIDVVRGHSNKSLRRFLDLIKKSGRLASRQIQAQTPI